MVIGAIRPFSLPNNMVRYVGSGNERAVMIGGIDNFISEEGRGEISFFYSAKEITKRL
jgi:hypothetical protein